MADTIRTIQELNQLLADNTTGDISAQDIRDILASMNVHAEIGLASWTSTIGTTWTKVPLDTAGAFSRGFAVDTVNNQIDETPVQLKADIYIEVQPTEPPAGEDLDFAAFVNGLQAATTRRGGFTAAGLYSWAVGVQLAQNDTVDLRVRGSTASQSVTLTRALLRAKRIGIE